MNKMADLFIAAAFLLFLSLYQSPHPVHAQSPSGSSCPLDFSLITSGQFAFVRQDTNASQFCNAVREELNVLVAAQLNRSQLFLFDPPTATACLQQFQTNLQQRQGVTSNIQVQCSIDSQSLSSNSTRCPNITSVSDFRTAVGPNSLSKINSACSGHLDSGASCSGCTAEVVSSVAYRGPSSNWTCLDFSHIYAAGVVNKDGPLNSNTVTCLFYQQGPLTSQGGKRQKHVWKLALIGVAAFVFLIVVGVLAAWLWWWRRRLRTDEEEERERREMMMSRRSALEQSMHSNASLIRFEMEEMKAATNNFHRTRIIGQGGFGNVYKGVLEDGSVVALKRFKNCSPAGDEGFVHEVEMISSVRHKNLVPILGLCTGSFGPEGHQRIIVYEFMPNGSLDDHLFGKLRKNLGWLTRQKIALGTARGLAYLHNGAQPAIIHRDIKCSNILLDSEFNAKVADFGLAKFAPEGISHLTTGVAGTQGYVAPEYVLYQQLTDKSDVYSFGIVFLELLTGRKALVHDPASGQPLPIADWAWDVVKRGRFEDILQQGMEELGAAEVLERFVLVALLCAHPQVAYRPSMSQVVKMLETNDFSLPSLPERPVSLMLSPAELSATSSGSVPFYFSSDGAPR